MRRSDAITLPQLQLFVFLLSSGTVLSAAWLVCHARDVVLVLRHAFSPLDPGAGKRLASPRAVCAAITLLGFCLAAEALVMLQAAGVL